MRPLPLDRGKSWILIKHNYIYALNNDVNNLTENMTMSIGSCVQSEFPLSMRYSKKIRQIISPRKQAYLHSIKKEKNMG